MARDRIKAIDGSSVMTVGAALEIVHKMAKGAALNTDWHPEQRKQRAREREALAIVEDLIVNEYGED